MTKIGEYSWLTVMFSGCNRNECLSTLMYRPNHMINLIAGTPCDQFFLESVRVALLLRGEINEFERYSKISIPPVSLISSYCLISLPSLPFILKQYPVSKIISFAFSSILLWKLAKEECNFSFTNSDAQHVHTLFIKSRDIVTKRESGRKLILSRSNLNCYLVLLRRCH